MFRFNSLAVAAAIQIGCTGGSDFPVLTALSQAAITQTELRLYEDGDLIVAYDDNAVISGPLTEDTSFLFLLAPGVQGVVFVELDVYYQGPFSTTATCPNLLDRHGQSSNVWLGVDLSEAYAIRNTRWRRSFTCQTIEDEDLDAWAQIELDPLAGGTVHMVMSAYTYEDDAEVRVELDAAIAPLDLTWP